MVVLAMLSFGTSPIAWRAAVAAVALACFLLRLAKVGLYSFPLTITCSRETNNTVHLHFTTPSDLSISLTSVHLVP